MDDATKIATVGAGTLLGDLTTRLHNAGARAMAHGTCPQVGVGGHFTIGGLGPGSRQWGSALDHVEEVEVVLANSSVVRASDTQNPDVFFAVKGAAASFGIVTEFKVRTQSAPRQAIQFSYILNLGDTNSKAQLLKDWQAFVSDPELPRTFATTLTVFELGIAVTGTFFGSKPEFDAFKSKRSLPGGDPGDDKIAMRDDWPSMLGNRAEDFILRVGGGVPSWFYSKSLPITSKTLIPSSGVDDLFHYIDTAKKGTKAWFVIFDLEGGAVNDRPVNSTAYAHRDTLFWMQSYTASFLGKVSSTAVNYLAGIHNTVNSSVPGVDSHAYPGYVDYLLDNPQNGYWGSNLPRLQRIKAQLDPGDVFHNPQSVRPAE